MSSPHLHRTGFRPGEGTRHIKGIIKRDGGRCLRLLVIPCDPLGLGLTLDLSVTALLQRQDGLLHESPGKRCDAHTHDCLGQVDSEVILNSHSRCVVIP